MMPHHSWWRRLADYLTPGDATDPGGGRLRLDEIDRKSERRLRALDEIERENQAIRRELRAEEELKRRQWTR